MVQFGLLCLVLPIAGKERVRVTEILVIDGHGGGLGKLIIAALREENAGYHIHAVGVNAIATAAMLRAGADTAATGENAVIVGCRNAEIITGPIGIVIADSMHGEITPKLATAIGQARAKRVLVPMNQCDNIIVGVLDQPIGQAVQGVIRAVRQITGEQT
ncbi:MAG: DUF3842 family protein [Firmicutes bacterium]|nr:DUF3842 family protein [Bacillota bacterium]